MDSISSLDHRIHNWWTELLPVLYLLDSPRGVLLLRVFHVSFVRSPFFYSASILLVHK